MKYLGIVSLGHDASVALIENGEILFAGHAERYSRVKNDGNINKALLDDAFQYGRPDAIVWYECPLKKLARKVWSGQWDAIKTPSVGEHLRQFGLHKLPRYYADHHESHAAAGYFTSGFADASILVVDAIGEFQTISIWQAWGTKMRLVWSQSYPDSLGLLYSAMTQRVGKKPNEEEYIMMGMAALGDPNRFKQDILQDFIEPTPAPRFKLKENVHRGIKWWRPDIQSEQDMYDLAAAMQSITEDYLKATALHIRQTLPSNNLILMGGVALNCKANTEIANLNAFTNIWIMPNPGDAGSSIGAIAAHTRQRIKWNGPYLGHNIDKPLDYQGAMKELLEGHAIGIANGKAEFGPRSLGNRSLIADPRGQHMKDTVNNIKHRELFRPFAPVILAEHANKYFNMPYGSTPFMQFTATCKFPNELPAITHYDGTARVQTLTYEQNPTFHKLLTHWYQATGCPILLNTSLNIKGQPLVNTWQDALDFQEHYGVKVF